LLKRIVDGDGERLRREETKKILRESERKRERKR
jgi:hypothetical protein